MVIKIEEPKSPKKTKTAELEKAGQKLAVGIDLGTTNSLIAIANPAKFKGEKGEIKIIADKNGNLLQPSVVAFAADGSVICGSSALLAKEAEQIHSIKRLMGKGRAELKESSANLPFILNNQEEGVLTLLAGGQKLSAIEISSLILKYLKELAEEELGQAVSQAVITVPAYFDEAARNATKQAAMLSGLKVLRLLSEPTAAALAYGLDKQISGIYLIFDIGGGTFDISVLRLQEGVFKVLGVSGDTNLGGDDFDEIIKEEIIERTSLIVKSPGQEQELRLIARKLKESLSDKSHHTIHFRLGSGSYQLTLSHEELNKLITPLIDKTLKLTRDLLEDLDLTAKEVDGVVLVGGSTRLPLIKERLGLMFGLPKVFTDLDPDKVVAIGAALQAQALTFGSTNLLLDVIPLSLGLEIMGGLAEKIIERNSAIPASVTKEFTTYADGQSGMKFHIIQGERELVKDCRSLAHFEIDNLPPLKAGLVKVEVTFAIDADGILTVSASEKISKQSCKVELKPTYGLDDAQIEDMVLKAAQNAKEDVRQRLLIEARVSAQSHMASLKTALAEDGELLSAKEEEAIWEALNQLEEQVKNTDYQQINQVNERLQDLSMEFFNRRTNKYIGEALKGKNINDL